MTSLQIACAADLSVMWGLVCLIIAAVFLARRQHKIAIPIAVVALVFTIVGLLVGDQ